MVDGGDRLAHSLAQLAALGDRFPVSCGPAPEGTWLPAAALQTPTDSAWADVIDAYGATLGTPQRRIAASIALQHYGTRLAGLAIGSWVLLGLTPSLAADQLHVHFEGGRTTGLWLPSPRLASPAIEGEDQRLTVGRELFDHLRPVVDAVRSHTTLGARRAWGNLAASCAGIFGALDRIVAPEERPGVRAKARAFLGASEFPIAGLVDWQVWGRPPSDALCHERRTCCLIRDVPGKQPCESCSIRPPAERRAAWDASPLSPRPAPLPPAMRHVVGATRAPLALTSPAPTTPHPMENS